jgi:hypothetical protein
LLNLDSVNINKCDRKGPCLFADQVPVIKEAYWDYYDTAIRQYVFLSCRLHQKYYAPSLLQIEESEKYHSGSGTATYETPDLQLTDYNGRWMTRSDDPECYPHRAWDEVKTCNICDIVCDIRDDIKYLNEDGACPFPDAVPGPMYWKVNDADEPCRDFLHPVMLSNIEATNRKRRKAAKAHLWKYLRDPHWLHLQINSGRRMIDVWKTHYHPMTFYFRSFETIALYLKSLPKEKKTPMFLAHLRKNLRQSGSFEQLLKKESERILWEKVERME